MAKRKTIGENPLDAVVSAPRAATKASRRGLALAGTHPKSERRKVVKERLTVHLPVELIDRVKNATYWTPGLTLAALAEEGLRDAVDKMEKKQRKSFPPRKETLKGGRPMK